MVKLTTRVSGVEGAIKGLRRFGFATNRALTRAVNDAADVAFDRSQVLVPVDMGPLQASGHVVAGKTTAGIEMFRIEYGGPSAPYALPVHEIPPTRATHEAPTGWKYVERAVRETKAAQNRAIQKRMRVEVRGSLT